MLVAVLDPGEGYMAAQEFVEGWLKRHSKWKGVHKKVVKSTLYGPARGTELAQYQSGGIVLKPGFFETIDKYGQKNGDALYAHEIGHGVESNLSSKWQAKAKELGIDVWGDDLPLGQFNMDEAFAETAAVIIMKDSRGLGLLKKLWPGWLELVTWGLAKV
jgi:hypothetical protein